MTIYNITVKGTKVVEQVDSDKIPDAHCQYVFQKGLEAILGRGRTKLAKKDTFADANAYAKEATAIFLKQVEDLYSGKTRMTGAGGARGKAKGEEAKLKAEMKRIARKEGDSMLKANGYAVSKVSTETKNKLAEALIAQEPEKYKKAALASLAAAAEAKADTIDFAALGIEVAMDETKVKAAEKKAAKAKAPAAPKVVPPPAKGPQRPSLRQ